MNRQKENKRLKESRKSGDLPAIQAKVKFSSFTSETLVFNWAIADNLHPCLQASKGSS